MPRREDNAYEHLVDEGSFAPFRDDLASGDPLGYPGYPEALDAAREQSGGSESVLAGRATIGGHEVELAAFRFAFLAGTMGEVAGERLAAAMERAARRAVPFVLHSATGGARMQEGMRALVQMPKLIAARLELADTRMPCVVVLGEPTTGGVLASIAGLADVTLAETSATIGFAGPRIVESVTGSPPGPGSHTTASALGNGLIDVAVGADEVHEILTRVMDVLAPDTPEAVGAPPSGSEGQAPKDGWEAIEASREAERLRGRALVTAIAEPWVELRGDRAGRDDPALCAAVARVRGRKVLLLALDRAHAPGPAAYRKARRCLQIAARLALPVVTFIDTRGADPSEPSEAEGIAWAIASLARDVLQAPVPVLSIVTGEGGSGGALAFAVGDRLLAYAHSTFSVIAPEAAAAILWRDPERAPEAARVLKVTARDLVALGIADAILPEPLEPGSLADTVAYHLDLMDEGTEVDRVALRRDRWRHRDGN